MPKRALRWEAQAGGGGWLGYSGQIIVAMVGERRAGSQAGRFYYKLDGVRTKRITRGHGDVASSRTAMRSAERAWSAWLEAADLSPGGIVQRDADAWDAIGQIADLLRGVADEIGGPVMEAFALAEDALAERHEPIEPTSRLASP